MGIKFIHLSDTHLGFADLDLIDSQGRNIREEDVYNSFKSVVDIILDEKPDFVLHTGDIFHRSSPSNRPLIVATQQIQRITSAGIPFYMIAGNHDYPKSILTTPIHQLYSEIPECRIYYSEKYEVYDAEKYIIHALPHINSESIFLSEISRIKITDGSKPNILLMHLSMPSFLMDEYGERAFPEESINILKNFEYVALGHWHKFRHLEKYGNTFYSGSTEVFSDRETGYEKGFAKVEIDSKTKVEFVSLKTRYYKTIKITDCSTKDKNEILNEIKIELGSTLTTGGIFTILLNNLDVTQVYEISKNDLEEIFNKALYFSIIKTVKGSDAKYEMDSDSFDLGEQLNEELKEVFKKNEELTKVSKLTERFLSEIEVEEADAD